MQIEDKLRQNAEQQPHKTALICGDVAYTYGQLWQAVTAKMDAMGDVKGPVDAPRCYRQQPISSLDHILPFTWLEQWLFRCIRTFRRVSWTNIQHAFHGVLHLKGWLISFLLRVLRAMPRR